LIVIVLVIVATALLFAWLLVELGRMALGEFRLPRPSAGVPAGPTGVPAGPTGVPAGPTGVPAGPAGAPGGAGPRLGNDADVELVVRERLYGGRHS
jgi:hypothetical protein